MLLHGYDVDACVSATAAQLVEFSRLVKSLDIVGRYDDRCTKGDLITIGRSGPFGFPFLFHRVRSMTTTSTLG